MYQSREEYEKNLKRIEELRKNYPKMQDIERVGNIIELIFAGGIEKWVLESHFKELEELLRKL